MPEYICQELIIEIFTRLPIEVILRFRSLSKSIRSCIDDPDFIRKHTLLSPQKFLIRHRNSLHDCYTLHSEDQLPLYPKHGNIDATLLKFPFKDSNEIVGSCNGIICLYGYDGTISLWNPSIRRKLTIRDRPSSKCKLLYINVGFGFDSITRDYKILRIYGQYSSERYSFVYSMRRDAWCHIDSPTTPFTHVISKACFLNGALHWLVKNYLDKWPEMPKSDYQKDISITYIMTFDLSTHVFGSIELPLREPDRETLLLTTINGSLAVMSSEGDNNRIWVRKVDKNYSAFWSVEFELKLNLHCPTKFVGLTNNGNFLFSWNNECLAYNHDSGKLSSLKKYGFNSQDIEMCVESLELLDTALPYKEECVIHIHENDDM